ncbi:MAG: 50S ribosomal protein L29 [Pseudomonadota bacterium]
MKANELREKNEDDLDSLLTDLGREQFNLRMQKGIGQLSKPDQIRKVRRDIARVKTVLNEKARA